MSQCVINHMLCLLKHILFKRYFRGYMKLSKLVGQTGILGAVFYLLAFGVSAESIEKG